MNHVVHIYHTNDLHSHFENWPKITQFINERRQFHESENEQMLLFDIGDHVDRSHPLTEATNGVANVTLMNKLHYQNVTIGNNEGITLTKDELNELYHDANFNVLVANLFHQDGSKIEWAMPYQLYELSGGVTAAVIGLTAPYKKFYDILGWQVEHPIEVLKHLLPEINKQADMIILLSHLGIYEDEKIASEFPEISLILGGHTHHHLEFGKNINQSVLCGAFKHGHYVGYVRLEINSMLKKVVNISAKTFAMESQVENKQIIHFIKKQLETSDKVLKSTVVQINQHIDLDWFKPSAFPHLLAEGLKEWCESEIGMVNAGVLLEPLNKGIVTKGDLHRICPHPINPCKVFLSGKELKEVILQANTDKMERLELVGFGFRGKVLGRMALAGVEVETVRLDDGERHVTSILVNNRKIEMDKVYSIGTIDMFTFGNLYPEISRAKFKRYYLPETLRDILAWKLSK